MPPPPDLQTLLDRAAIHDVLTRYFQGIDRGSPEQVRTCFTEDVQCWYDGKPSTRGLEALMDSFWAFKSQQSGAWKITTHFMGNLTFNELAREHAETETNAIAFLVLTTEGPGDKVTMRSLRYLDRFRRTADGWLICERQHTLDWSCLVPATFATATAKRVNARASHA
jgi:SnoaL-like domain